VLVGGWGVLGLNPALVLFDTKLCYSVTEMSQYLSLTKTYGVFADQGASFSGNASRHRCTLNVTAKK
jgi:hypothetical protein